MWQRLSYSAKLGAYGALGVGAFPMMLSGLMARQAKQGRGSGKLSLRPDMLSPGAVSTTLTFLPDIPVYLAALDPQRAPLRFEFPEPFVRRNLEVQPGVRLACWTANQRDASLRPTLIIVPGMFCTSQQNVVVRLARKAFYRWRMNVIAADMRGFGATARMSEAPASLTLHEGHDVVALARWARGEWKTPEVSVLGFSYGGGVALATAAASAGEVDRTVAFCPPVSFEQLLERLSQPIGELSAFGGIHVFYSWLLVQTAELRGFDDVRHYRDYVAQVAAPHYGYDLQSLLEAVDPLARIERTTTPTLVIHAEDDPVMAAEPVRELARRAQRAGRRNVRVELTRRGGHYGHWQVMPAWTEATLRSWLRV